MNIHSLGKRLMVLNMLRRRMMHGLHHEKEIVPAQYPLMNYLSKNPDATQQELADMLFVTPASVAQSTKRLQAAGLLEKTPDPDNMRKNRLRVTKTGQDVVDSFRSSIDSVDQQTFEGFSEEDLLLLKSMFDRMLKNMAAEEDIAMLAEMEQRDKLMQENHPDSQVHNKMEGQ